jgi:adenine-specific DNA glycosylase
LRGVGIPTASALLHFAFPNDYPILDVRALASLAAERPEYDRLEERFLAPARDDLGRYAWERAGQTGRGLA